MHLSLAGAAMSIIFVATKVCLPRQKYVCCDKHTFVATKDMFYHDKHVFVATKMILAVAPTCDMH